MTGPVDPSRLHISLEHGDTDDEGCQVSPVDLFERFTAPRPGYPGFGSLEYNVSVLTIPDDIEQDWFGAPASKWMRQKIRRAEKLGYEFRPFVYNDWLDDIFEINTSKEERQGRVMDETYRRRPRQYGQPTNQPCPRHQLSWFGIFKESKLYAYANVIQAGEMMIFSQILGHGDRMEDGIMNYLVYEAVKWHHERARTPYAVYYLAESGTDGLKFFKRKMGFVPRHVWWELSRRDPATSTVDALA